jgi:chemotaxis protein MotA
MADTPPIRINSDDNRKKQVDRATIIGLSAGLILLVAAVALGGSAATFFNLRAAIIVLGGTVAVTMITCSAEDLSAVRTIFTLPVIHRPASPKRLGIHLLELAGRARSQGYLKLPSFIDDDLADDYLRKAMELLADGVDTPEIERLLERDLDTQIRRYERGAHFLRRAAEIAPAMGLIGTLIGLIQLLAELNDPQTIGPNMALALLTTFYGAVLGTMVLAPLADKITRRAQEEEIAKRMILTAATSIARGENPRKLELHLNAILSPSDRMRYFDEVDHRANSGDVTA